MSKIWHKNSMDFAFGKVTEYQSQFVLIAYCQGDEYV